MLEAIKTPAGAYNVTLIVSGIIWILSGIGILAGFNMNRVKAVEAQQKTRAAEAAEKVADEKRIAAEKRLKVAEAEIVKLRPKPLAFRMREVLSKIDAKILPALKAGRKTFEGGITASQFNALQTIASEPGAEALIQVSPDVKMGVGMGPEGMTYSVIFTLTNAVLAE